MRLLRWMKVADLISQDTFIGTVILLGESVGLEQMFALIVDE